MKLLLRIHLYMTPENVEHFRIFQTFIQFTSKNTKMSSNNISISNNENANFLKMMMEKFKRAKWDRSSRKTRFVSNSQINQSKQFSFVLSNIEVRLKCNTLHAPLDNRARIFQYYSPRISSRQFSVWCIHAIADALVCAYEITRDFFNYPNALKFALDILKNMSNECEKKRKKKKHQVHKIQPIISVCVLCLHVFGEQTHFVMFRFGTCLTNADNVGEYKHF